MKKNLAAACAVLAVGGLGLAGGALANSLDDNGVGAAAANLNSGINFAYINVRGIGHTVLIPYYNVQAGNATLINLVNTDTVNGKAVKVRFRGASNSDDVYDFQVYMSPGDVWTANVTRGTDGRAVLTTNDKSCTIPQNVNGSFVTARLNPRLTGDALAAETREGYVEIFNMADIPPAAIDTTGGPVGPGAGTFGAVLATANALFTTIKHVNGVAPCFSTTAGQAALNALQNDPADLGAAYTLGLRAASTGLYANWTIINVPKSGAASGEAIALEQRTGFANPNTPATRSRINFFPQTGAAVATPNLFTADPALRTAVAPLIEAVQNGSGGLFAGTLPLVVASSFDFPDLSTVTNTGVLDPLRPLSRAGDITGQLATKNIINEYLTDSTIGAFTDWVFSMPTRRYSVALDYRPVAPAPFVMAYSNLGTSLTNPRDYFTAANTTVVGGQICTATSGLVYYDREETTLVGNNFVISPNPPAAGFRLCGEVSVLTFNAPGGQSVLGAEIARTDFATGTIRDGWTNVSMPGLTTGNSGLATGNGLPIIGGAFVRAGNGSVSANFGAVWKHRYVRP